MRHRQNKHEHGRGGGGVNLGLIITPMLDMAFQLLAFFVMTYHPSALEGHIDGTLLPPTKVATKGPKSDPKDLSPAIDEEPKFTDALMVSIRAVPKGQLEGDRKDGEPRSVEIKKPEAASPTIVSGNPTLPLWNYHDTGRPRPKTGDDFVSDLTQKLDRELKSILKETGGKMTDIKLEADSNLKHYYWMEFYDACKLAGFQNIHFVAPPLDRK